MNVMTINAGGSSLKFSIINTETQETMLLGAVEGLGQPAGQWSVSYRGHTKKETGYFADHYAAVRTIAHNLREYKGEIEIEAIGHRVAHGGSKFREPVAISEAVIDEIENLSELAPLHNPPALMAIRSFRSIFPNVTDVAVFDTGFHRELPPRAYTYGLPWEISEAGVRRFGFHGLAFQSMTSQGANLAGKSTEKLKIVSLMLGSGTTANAYMNGRSVDVSTGFTPMPGLLQSTRPGDFDPGILLYLQKKYGYGYKELEQLLYKKSGWFGIAGISADLKDIIEAQEENERAHLAVDVLTYGAAKYVGAYMTVMGGLDLLVFGGGVGERSPVVRTAIAEYFRFVGLKVDEEINQNVKGNCIISTADSGVKVAVVSVREDLVIAENTARIISQM